MPIIYPELEDLLIDWEMFTRLHTIKRIGDKTGEWVYSKMKQKIDAIYIEKIRKLFKSLTIEEIEVEENVTLDRVNCGFVNQKLIRIKSSL
tara:strand:- start:406 stop:678 length:273 start_codon:yes stop_codon:yes gene_type:complete